MPQDPPSQTLFDARRSSCPMCASTRLRQLLETPDLLRQRAGRFVLDRCEACGHVFQNPALNAAGLKKHYQGFYDPQGVEQPLWVRMQRRALDRRRARVLPRDQRVRRWLDVGSWNGLFCRHARRIWTRCVFDALDQSPSIAQAVHEGWVDHAHVCQLDQLNAPVYDVVSMFHYLEHCPDPRSQLAEARRVLRPGGWLLIELPDPESRLGQILGRYWLSWFQPQHLHLMPASVTERLLQEQGFRVVTVQRGEAHRPEDLASALRLMLGHKLASCSPIVDRARVQLAVELASVPVVLAGTVADELLARWLRREGWSNSYRVLAQSQGGR